MCDKVDIGAVYGSDFYYNTIGGFLYNMSLDELRAKNITNAQILNLLGPQIHSMEIKRSEKESICVYKLSFDVSKIQISPQEVEKFEKFAMEKNGGRYRECEKFCISGLKLAKFNNKTDASIYNVKDLLVEIVWEAGKAFAEEYEGKNVAITRLIYGKPQASYNNIYPGISERTSIGFLEFTLKDSLRYDSSRCEENECRRDIKEVQNILKWAKSVEKGTAKSTTNSSQNPATPSPAPSVASVSDNLQSIKLATKDDYVNLRKAPSGEILAPIYKKDFDKITLKKLDGGNEKWLKVLYFPPNVTNEKQAITGYIHTSQIAK